MRSGLVGFAGRSAVLPAPSESGVEDGDLGGVQESLREAVHGEAFLAKSKFGLDGGAGRGWRSLSEDFALAKQDGVAVVEDDDGAELAGLKIFEGVADDDGVGLVESADGFEEPAAGG